MPQCQGSRAARPQSPLFTQLTRIELKLNKIMRHLGIDGESDAGAQP